MMAVRYWNFSGTQKRPIKNKVAQKNALFQEQPGSVQQQGPVVPGGEHSHPLRHLTVQ